MLVLIVVRRLVNGVISVRTLELTRRSISIVNPRLTVLMWPFMRLLFDIVHRKGIFNLQGHSFFEVIITLLKRLDIVTAFRYLNLILIKLVILNIAVRLGIVDISEKVELLYNYIGVASIVKLAAALPADWWPTLNLIHLRVHLILPNNTHLIIAIILYSLLIIAQSGETSKKAAIILSWGHNVFHCLIFTHLLGQWGPPIRYFLELALNCHKFYWIFLTILIAVLLMIYWWVNLVTLSLSREQSTRIVFPTPLLLLQGQSLSMRSIPDHLRLNLTAKRLHMLVLILQLGVLVVDCALIGTIPGNSQCLLLEYLLLY